MNPNAESDQRVKDESELLKKERKQREGNARYQDGGGYGYNRGTGPSMTADYMHNGSDDENDMNNISNIKRQFKGDKYKKPSNTAAANRNYASNKPKKSYAPQGGRRSNHEDRNRSKNRRESEYIGGEEERSDDEDDMNDEDKGRSR